MDTTLWIITLTTAGIGLLGVMFLMRAISERRPERTPYDRDQAMAEIRTLTGRGAEEGEPTWDAQVRGTPPTTDGGWG